MTDFAKFRQHARDCFPRECCGVFLGPEYIPVDNVAGDPTKGFALNPRQVNPLFATGRVTMVAHSHTAVTRDGYTPGLDPDCPSKLDMEQQRKSGLRWAICCTDGADVTAPFTFHADEDLSLPLIGRKFRHGVTDCYAAIRAWFFQKRGVTLRDFPRDDSWWDNGDNMYVQGFSKAGFRRVSEDDARPGDVIFFRIGSEVPNHAAVLLDNGLIYHHVSPPRRRGIGGGIMPSETISGETPAGRWLQRAAMVVRYAHG